MPRFLSASYTRWRVGTAVLLALFLVALGVSFTSLGTAHAGFLRSALGGLGLLLGVGLWGTHRALRRMLGASVDEVHSRLEALGRGEPSEPLEVEGAGPSVLRSLSEAQRRLAQLDEERRRAGKLQGQFSAIVESSSEAIVSTTLDGLITTWNPAAEATFGYTAAEVLGHSIAAIVPADLEGEEQRALARLARGERLQDFQTLRRKKDGGLVPISATVYPIKDGAGTIVGASMIVHDLSQRRRSERYRIMGRDILRVLNEESRLDLALKRVISLARQGTGVDAVGLRLQHGDDFPYFQQEGFSAEFVQKERSLLARGRDGGICRESDGRVCLECTCGLVVSGRVEGFTRGRSAGGSVWFNGTAEELDALRSSDPRTHPRDECLHQGYASVALVPIRAKGRIVGLLQLNDRRQELFSAESVVALEEIAESVGEALLRKQAEDELWGSKDLVLSLLQSTDQGIYGVDREGRCTFINASALTMLGYAQEDCLGKEMHSLVHHHRQDGAPYPADDCPVAKAQRLAEGCRLDNEVFFRRDGSSFHVEYSSRPILEKGEQSGAVVFFSDISDRKRAEEEMTLLEGQIHQVQKMESIGSLAGGVAHDFNNKLSVILGNAQLALGEELSEPLRESLEEIRKAATQSADLTRQLLAFARKQTIAPRVLDLNETVASMLKMLQRLIGENVRLTFRPGPGVWLLNFDPSQIDQILANLCVNARDAITGSGTITIETANATVTPGPRPRFPDAAPGEYVQLTVSDDGSGMSPETQERIFEPFFTTKEPGKGTGLGLATVFGIVKQNQGSIDVESALGRGTTFTLLLPRHVGGVQVGAVGEEEAPAGTETILLVEDEAPILNVTAHILRRQGYRVLAAGTPLEAQRLAKEHDGKIALLVTDVVMPGMSGKELAQALRAIRPGLACLYVSGYTADVISKHGVLEAGVNFLPKPFTVRGLASKVREVLDAR